MGLEFLARTIRATALTALVAALAASAVWDRATGAAVLLGAAWSLANLKLLETAVRAFGPRGQVEPLRAVLALLLKGPVLYGAGWWLLAAGWSPSALLAGFSLPFAVLPLQSLGAQLVPGRRTGLLGAALLLVSLAGAEAQANPGTEVPPAVAEASPAGATGEAHAAPADSAAHGAGAAVHEGDGHAAGAAHGEGAHAEHAEHPELPNFITFLRSFYQGKEQPAWLTFLHRWENVVFSLIAALLLILFFGISARPRRMVPTGLQNAGEALLGGLHDFFLGILGPEGKKYVPFVGTLFLYIVTMNWMGLLPFMKAPTSSINTTLALGLCVFVYVQYIGITKNGLRGYLYHFAGQPKDAIGWGSAVLLFPLEIMGELIKPISLSARLFGNILSEDILLAVLVGLGVTVLAFMNSPIGLPLQLPFMLLSTLFGLIQGLVFSLLAAIYIVMMLPHEDHGHDEAHAGAQAAHH
jgi:F-type H+-transporting ATPase subunit a